MASKSLKYSARKMLQYSPEQLQQKLTGVFTLVFDDGEYTVDAKSTVFSRYAWNLHVEYPDTPLLFKHHAYSITQNSRFGSNTHIKLLEAVGWSVYDAYSNRSNGPDINIIAKRIYEITNEMYNHLVTTVEQNVSSIDILDFIEIMDYPTVKEVLDTAPATEEGIEKSYSVLKRALKLTPELEHNNLSKASRAGLVREGQLLQCLGPRGYITDVDSNYFRTPIMRGFAKGMRKFHDALIESRSAALSLFNSKLLLRDAEYFARRLQILCQIVETVHPGDCGSDHYLRWKIRDKEFDSDGNMICPSDLETFNGKYYLDESTGNLKVITPNDKHLFGKILKFRSPIAGCNHPNPNGICATCFGELALSVPKRTNLGHLCAAAMTQQSNQNILSTKHYLTGVSNVSSIVIPPEYRDYLEVSSSGNGYLFKETLKDKKVYLVILPHFVPGLVDLNTVESVEELGLAHVSEITVVGVRVVDKNGNEFNQTLHVGVDRRKASFTYPMLEHIQKTGWSFDEKGNYIIDMTDWDYKRPALKLPLRQYNMSDHAKAISITIESNKEKLKERDGSQSPEDVLFELANLVNSKLSVNIALLEVILLGSLIQSSAQKNYYFPKYGTHKELTVAPDTIANRSLGGTVTYNAMAQNIVDPNSLFHKHRPQLMMDVFLKPQETLTDPYRYDKYYWDGQ